MAATVDEIESALTAPWRTLADGGTAEWTGTGYDAIAYDNVGFDPSPFAGGFNEDGTPKPGQPWMEVATSAGTLRSQDVAAVILTGHPTVIVSAHTPIGTGKRAARLLIAAAHDLYRGREITAGTSSMTAYAFSPAVEMPKEGWYKLTTQISFRLI